MVYRVKVPVFEGPLDLLLYLIRKQELDIYDIPIAQITEQFLAYIQLMKEAQLELGGEFLRMAATLLYIKSKMLLPRHDEELEEDPREELVEQLLEYEKYKKAALHLAQREEEWAKFFPPGGAEVAEEEFAQEDIKIDVGVYDLLGAFLQVIARLPDEKEEVIQREQVKTEEMMDYLRGVLARREYVPFSELFAGVRTRLHAIVLFLALLELVRLAEVKASQEEPFAEILIYKANGGKPYGA